MECELCTPVDVLLTRPLAYARYDGNALSRGHVLVVPRRHVASFFDMTVEEQAEVLRLLNEARRVVAEKFSPE